VTPATLAVLGPTATGKTALAIDLALDLGAEIVTCDSVQVYRRMDIGSAKPTVDERRGVPHHLIDMVDAGGEYTAADFARDAAAVIDDCHARGRPVIITGGSGLYFRILLYGLIDAPGADQGFRSANLADEQREPGILRKRLDALDAETAASIQGNNLPRLLRALEILHLTGVRPSELRRRHGFATSRYPDVPVYVLDGPNDWLRQRLQQREQAMLDAGLLEEIQALWRSGVAPTWRVFAAVTYRQACDYLRGSLAREALVAAMVRGNWAYVRRQRVWFRKERATTWLDAVDRDGTLRYILSQHRTRHS
jgi:tRNA dimethylallyltransferase